MSDISATADALVSFKLIKWLSAHCPDHSEFDEHCPQCLVTPQACAAHPKTNGTFPGFDLFCTACQKTRPGYVVVENIGEQVITAEEAVKRFRIPFRTLHSGRTLRIPLNLTKKR
jgi:hypothetical protein